jgi:hypothetical protein
MSARMSTNTQPARSYDCEPIVFWFLLVLDFHQKSVIEPVLYFGGKGVEWPSMLNRVLAPGIVVSIRDIFYTT